MIRRMAAVVAALALMISSFPALAASETDAEGQAPAVEGATDFDRRFDQGFDIVVLRPLSAIVLVMGAALLVPAAILSAAGGSEGLDNAYDILVKTPWQDLADRPLGEWGA